MRRRAARVAAGKRALAWAVVAGAALPGPAAARRAEARAPRVGAARAVVAARAPAAARGGGGGRGHGGGAGTGGGAGPAAGRRPARFAATGEMVMSLAGTWTFTPSGAAATTITVPGGGWVAQGFRSTNRSALSTHGDGPEPGTRPGHLPRVRRHQPSGHPDRRRHDGRDEHQTTSFTPSVFDVTERGAARG